MSDLYYILWPDKKLFLSREGYYGFWTPAISDARFFTTPEAAIKFIEERGCRDIKRSITIIGINIIFNEHFPIS